MLELATGYVIGMVTGYLIFRRSVVETNRDLKNYLEKLVEGIYGLNEPEEENWFD